MKLKITQVRSSIGRKEDQKRTAIALGLGRIGKSRLHDDNPVIRGMINKIIHMIKVEEIAEAPGKKVAKKVDNIQPKVVPVEIIDTVEEKTVKASESAPKKSVARKTSSSTGTPRKKADKPETKTTGKKSEKTSAAKTVVRKKTVSKTEATVSAKTGRKTASTRQKKTENPE
ncbi:MAG: 50S ribosomal protein L30 [Candidatus Cloacimonetes bacterium]|nr:50S ribosomal protein L30 [Candidatus Cloacimonadota bacterium]